MGGSIWLPFFVDSGSHCVTLAADKEGIMHLRNNKKQEAYDFDLVEVNKCREAIGLPVLKSRMRICMRCRKEFASIEKRRCYECLAISDSMRCFLNGREIVYEN